MKVHYVRQVLPDHGPSCLHLEPESDQDCQTLTRLIDEGRCIGCGYRPDGQPMHAQIEVRTIQPKAEGER